MVTFANNIVSNDLKFSFSKVTPKYSEYGSLADVADFYSFNFYVVNNPFWTPLHSVHNTNEWYAISRKAN